MEAGREEKVPGTSGLALVMSDGLRGITVEERLFRAAQHVDFDLAL
jgi:hypothetical protein